MVDYKVFGWEYRDLCRQHITPERIADAVRALAQPRTPARGASSSRQRDVLSAEDIIVDLSPMHYGMQEKNPMEFIFFYSKYKPNGELVGVDLYTAEITASSECSPPGPGDISLLMPASFGEVLLRVYTRDVQYVITASSLPLSSSILDVGTLELSKLVIAKSCRPCPS
jgi:hypothetical protein